MSVNTGMQTIVQLQRKWKLSAIMIAIFSALGVSLLLTVFLQLWIGIPMLITFLFFAIMLPVFLLVNKAWKVETTSIARHLNAHYPELEESTQLLLKGGIQEQSLIQQLQKERVSDQLARLKVHSPFRRSLLAATLLMLCGIVAFGIVQGAGKNTPGTKTSKYNKEGIEKREVVLPSVKSAEIIITPPLYTQSPPISEMASSPKNLP